MEESNQSHSEYMQNVSKPQHYQANGMEFESPECIQITRHLSFDLGCAFKYLWRAGKKGDPFKEIEDLEKAVWYVKDQIYNFPSFTRSETAKNIFCLLKFEENSLSTLKKDAMRSVLFDNLDLAILHIRGLISHILIKEFACADEETKKRVRSILHEIDVPEFLK